MSKSAKVKVEGSLISSMMSQIKMPERISVAVIIPGDVEVLAARRLPG